MSESQAPSTRTRDGRRVVFLAAPYSQNPAACIGAVCRVATVMIESTAFTPVVPTLSMLWDTVTPRPYEWWSRVHLDVMQVCDAVLRLPGDSPGADREIEKARSLGIPVLSLSEMPDTVSRTWHEESVRAGIV